MGRFPPYPSAADARQAIQVALAAEQQRAVNNLSAPNPENTPADRYEIEREAKAPNGVIYYPFTLPYSYRQATPTGGA